MKKEDYLKRHIPHRLTLLTILRDRFEKETDETINEKKLGDFYKCAKDISILMTRSLLYELGLKLKQTKNDEIISLNIESKNDKMVLNRIKNFEIIQLYPDQIPTDLKDKLITILKIANRAISHIDDENNDVDHKLVTHAETILYLIPIIYYVEKIVNSNIYKINL